MAKRMQLSVAEQLREAIRAELAKGTSLREIARRADVAPSAISKFLSGKSCVVETIEALAKALGKDLLLS
jgi:transcriptional regulator with XRE-family HTH domain